MSGYVIFDGFNSVDNNADEVDGAGVNYPPIDPTWFSSFTPVEVIILDADDLAMFDGCADLVIRGEPSKLVFPRETRTLKIRSAA